MTNTIDFLLGGATDVTFSDGYDLGLSTTRLNELYAGEITNGNLRYAECWRTGVRDNSNQPNWAVTMKYWWEEDEESAMLNCQLVPMLRMSEVYLIAMETSTDLAEVNGWYKTYMVQRNVGTSTDFASLDAVRTWVRAEYCREFIAEGQAFYTYKRAGATTMFGTDRTMGESDYILPLPDTEYNPNNL